MTAPRPSDVVEPEQAAAIFAEFAVAEELALRFPADGCYARTHWIVQRLLERGVTPSKVWAFAASAGDLLWTETADHSEGRVQWAYHVAPVLVVREGDGDSREIVFDPLLFARPVAVEVVANRTPRHADFGANGSRRTAATRTRRLRILARSRSH